MNRPAEYYRVRMLEFEDYIKAVKSQSPNDPRLPSFGQKLIDMKSSLVNRRALENAFESVGTQAVARELIDNEPADRWSWD